MTPAQDSTFDQVPFNWFEAIAQDTLAQFDCAVARILTNTHIAIAINQDAHARLFDPTYTQWFGTYLKH